ncbi:carbohydrate ABC transporter permease [Paenibacillus sp. PL2-23]|uniref:carbohydrate ABC transporter permease n=2 Tax=Paenibacillus sp. PL2-23 TaxID=2100729 RepID=UPI00349E6D71
MRLSRDERVLSIINYVALTLIGLSCLFPLMHIISVSFSGYNAIITDQVTLWPVGISWENYDLLLQGTDVVRGFTNNVVITVIGSALSMLATILAAYPLSRSYCIGRKPITMAIVFTMLFQGGLIPTFLLVKNLGLIDSYWSLWFLTLVSAYNMLIMRTFFQQIPEEMIESARMDGCSEWRILFNMILPLSKPVLATLTLFYAVHYWNIFLGVLIYINDSDKKNLTVMVQQMIQSQQLIAQLGKDAFDVNINLTPEGIKSAGIMVLVAPLMIIYPFLQKYFVKGVMLGSVKG